jgi:gonadotropin-releasing hormone receptor
MNISKDLQNEVMPREMSFTTDGLVSIITYSVLFIIATLGNLSVLCVLYRRLHVGVNFFIVHLCIADSIVTFIMIPLEIGWHITVAWKASDFGCSFMMFFRIIGFYLSSFLVIMISLDRYIAVVHPLLAGDATRRRKVMLAISWVLSIIASMPQVCTEILPRY